MSAPILINIELVSPIMLSVSLAPNYHIGVEQTGPQGIQGITPHVGENGNWYIGETDTGMQAQGAPGPDGLPGITPHIGENGNWYIDETDTGVKAEGTPGETGPTGPQGPKGDNGEDSTVPGPQGPKGDDGYTPIKGVDYFDGETGPAGADGEDGSDATVTAANMEAVLDAAAADSLADADTVNFNKSSVLKKITWANIKSALSSVFAALSGATFTGTITTPAITLPTNGQLLLTIPDTDGHATGNITNAFNSGYSSSAIGDLVYLDVNSTWQKADKGTSAATYSGLLGIALEVKAAGNALKVALPGSFVYATGFPALTVGASVYMDDAGAIVVTQPSESDHRIRKVGFAIHADKIFFFPSNDFITHV